MTDGVYVNRVRFKIDKDAFSDRFRIFKMEKIYGKRVKDMALSLGDELGSVCAIKYHYHEDSTYMMCLKGHENAIDEKLERISLGLDRQVVPVSSVPDSVLLDLLSISMNTMGPDDEMNYANLEGSLYILNELPKKNDDHFVALNIRYSEPKDDEELFEGAAVSVRAVTFCDIECDDVKKHTSQSKLNNMISYVVTEDKGICMYSDRIPKMRSLRKFVRHGYRSKTTKIVPFFSIDTINTLNKSKMGVLDLAMKRLKRSYQGIITELELVRTDLFDTKGKRFQREAKVENTFKKDLKTKCGQNKFNLVDCVNDSMSRYCCRYITKAFREILDVEICMTEDIAKGECNIVLLQDMEDSRYECHEDVAVQHILIDSFKKVARIKKDVNPNVVSDEDMIINGEIRSMISVSTIDVLIKKEIIDNTHFFTDWFFEKILKGKTDRTWYFMERPRIENPDPEHRMEAKFGNMVLLKMDPDGSMEYEIIDEAHYLDPDRAFVTIAWFQYDQNGYHQKGVVSDGKNTYSLLDTEMFMIPEVEAARQQFFDNEPVVKDDGTSYRPRTGLRTKDGFEDYFKACIGINHFQTDDNDSYYYVGMTPTSIKFKIARSAKIRHVKNLEHGEPMSEDIYSMMAVPFVRFLGLTVFPYPFKFIHEFEKMHGMKAYVDEDYDIKIHPNQCTLFDVRFF